MSESDSLRIRRRNLADLVQVEDAELCSGVPQRGVVTPVFLSTLALLLLYAFCFFVADAILFQLFCCFDADLRR